MRALPIVSILAPSWPAPSEIYKMQRSWLPTYLKDDADEYSERATAPKVALRTGAPYSQIFVYVDNWILRRCRSNEIDILRPVSFLIYTVIQKNCILSSFAITLSNLVWFGWLVIYVDTDWIYHLVLILSSFQKLKTKDAKFTFSSSTVLQRTARETI